MCWLAAAHRLQQSLCASVMLLPHASIPAVAAPPSCHCARAGAAILDKSLPVQPGGGGVLAPCGVPQPRLHPGNAVGRRGPGRGTATAYCASMPAHARDVCAPGGELTAARDCCFNPASGRHTALQLPVHHISLASLSWDSEHIAVVGLGDSALHMLPLHAKRNAYSICRY